MITSLEGTNSEENSSIEELRCILESQQKRRMDDKEVQDIASSLLSLFEVLAEGDANDR